MTTNGAYSNVVTISSIISDSMRSFKATNHTHIFPAKNNGRWFIEKQLALNWQPINVTMPNGPRLRIEDTINMKLKPNPNSILLLPPKQQDKVLPSGIVVKPEQDKNTNQFTVIAIGNKVDKRLDLTLDSKVIVAGGQPIVIDDVTYVVSTEGQILVVLNK